MKRTRLAITWSAVIVVLIAVAIGIGYLAQPPTAPPIEISPVDSTLVGDTLYIKYRVTP